MSTHLTYREPVQCSRAGLSPVKSQQQPQAPVVACWLAACLRRRDLSGLEESELSHYCTTQLSLLPELVRGLVKL